MSLPLYLPQRPLSCCFDRKDFLAYFDPKGFLAVGLARGKKWQRAGNTGKGKERREAPPFPSSYHSPRTLPNPILLKNFPWGASAEERVPTPLIVLFQTSRPLDLRAVAYGMKTLLQFQIVNIFLLDRWIPGVYEVSVYILIIFCISIEHSGRVSQK